MEAIKIYPELIKWRAGKIGKCPLTIRFDYKGNRVGNEPLNIQIKVEDWDQEEKRVKKSDPSFEFINLIIDQKLSFHTQYFLKRQAFGQPINPVLIKQYIANGTLDSFLSFAEWVIENKRLKDGLQYSDDTKRRYRDEIKRLQEFRKVILFKDITVKFLEDYKVWMQVIYQKKDKTRLQHNSIWKALGFIRLVYNEAIKQDIILPENNPFKKFDVGSCETNMEKIKYLDVAQMEKIESVLEGNQLQDLTVRVGWRFLAMCVSGLRISDAMLLNDALFNDAGHLEVIPHKTRRHGNKALVPMISNRQIKYMQKTLSLPLPKTNAKSFRTTFNIHLNLLAAHAGLPHLTSHMGRHTMGSFLVDAGIEKKAAMAMLGIKKETVIDTYLHLKESKLNKEAEKLRNIF